MASKSVNVPTNTAIKEKDVNSKLQLYGIYSAFANGKVPSNKQIDVAMNSALEWGPMRQPSKKLSGEGQQLVADVRDVIEKTKVMLLNKNEGNLLQDFIWQTQSISSGGAQKPNMPIEKDAAKQHGQEALEGLRTLGQLLITNGQFRKLLSDASILLRDIAGDAAQKTANKAKPGEDQLSQIDQPAEDNTWHEAPDFSKDTMRSKIPFSKKDAQDMGGDVSQSAVGSRDPNDAAAAADQGTASQDDAKRGAKEGAQNAKNRIGDKMSEDDKEKMRQYRERTREYFKGKMPRERRDQIIFRLKKMVVEVQSHRDYQQAIDTLLRLAEEYAGHGKNLAGQGTDSAKGARNQGPVYEAEADLMTLLERFANSTSFDDLKESINQIYRDADSDPELKGWFKDIDNYIRRCLQEQGYILQDESNEKWNSLYEKGRFLLRERYRNHTDRIVDEFKFLADQFDQDPQNKAFARSVDKLFKNLGNDSDGKPTFKPHLIKDLTEVLLPAFFEHIRYVPIPRIEYSDPMIDAVVENLVVEGDNLAPNMFEFGSDNFWRWGRKGFGSRNKNKVMLSVSGVQMDLRDVAYYVKKKEGFPGITDKGVMDIFLGGTGLSFKVAMETADKNDRNHFFKINTVNVEIKNMNIKVKQSNHKLLFNLFKPIMFKVLRPVIQKVVEKQVRDNITKLDSFLYQIKKEADRATEEAKANPDPENIQNMYQNYFNAFQREMTKAKEKKDQAQASKGETNVALTQKDSIFKNISLPGGISTKATEYQDLARKGDKWESPVFSIGGAKESSNLPAPSKPQRKPHNVQSGGVRDGGSNVMNDVKSNGGTGVGNYGSTGGDNYGSTGGGDYGSNNETYQNYRPT